MRCGFKNLIYFPYYILQIRLFCNSFNSSLFFSIATCATNKNDVFLSGFSILLIHFFDFILLFNFVASVKKEKIAIEIETGKSNYIRNVQQDLLAKYDKIMVVVTDKIAFEKVEKGLAKTGLLIAKRVELVLATGRGL